METETLAAGPSLDVLIAERVMGWQRCQWVGYGKTGISFDGYALRCTVCGRTPATPPWSRETLTGYCGRGLTLEDSDVPEFSTSIADAWKVVDKFRFFELTTPNRKGDPLWRVVVDASRGFAHGYGETAPLAISRAALAATDPARRPQE